jgi:hypothetical protein
VSGRPERGEGRVEGCRGWGVPQSVSVNAFSPSVNPLVPGMSGTEGFGDRAAHARLVELERRRSRKYDDAAALITYHERSSSGHASRARGGSANGLPLPAWARAAERVAAALVGVLPTVLATNNHDARLSRPPFSRTLHVDLLQLSGLHNAVPARAMCGLKISALLYGWRTEALPARVLLLDHDVIIQRPQQLLRMLDPLHYCTPDHSTYAWTHSHTSHRCTAHRLIPIHILQLSRSCLRARR